MLNFTKTLKLYVFKEQKRVDLTIRVSDNYAQGYHMTTDQMTEMLANWNKETGFNAEVNGHNWLVINKHYAPRPNCEPASYVRFSVSRLGNSQHFRLSPSDMYDLEKDFFFQMNNRMHWD